MNYKLLIAGITLITLGTLLLSQNQTSLKNQKEFQEFIQTHKKTYNSVESQNYRYSIFLQNKNLIKNHNKKESTYTLKINQFGDLTWEEFQKNYLSKLSDEKSKCEKDNKFFKNFTKSENAVDWDKSGYVQKVKNQGQCGSCWAFSAIGALESAIAMKSQTNEIPNLSEQELVDCSKSYGNMGCNGGLMNLGYDYILEHHINTETNYPYKGSDNTCLTSKIGEGKQSITKCVRVPPNTDGLTAALRTQPVAVAFYVNLGFQFYHGGVFDPWFCNGEPNHGVLAVGFDLGASKPFYRVKNSWGVGWGESGYFRMAIGKKAKGTCDIAGHGMNFVPVV